MISANRGRSSGCYALLLVILLATLGLSKSIDSNSPRTLVRPLRDMPPNIHGWTKVSEEPLPAEILSELKASSYINRTYSRGDESIGVFVAYYTRQKAGANIHPPKYCLPGNGWRIIQHEWDAVRWQDGSTEVNRYHIRNGDRRMVVLYWYQSRRHIVGDEMRAKMCLFWEGLRRGDTSGSLVRVTFPDSARDLDQGLQFAAVLIPEIQSCVGR